MTPAEAVRRFIFDGAVVGMGGQSIGRSSMVIYHEMIRQRKKDLTPEELNILHRDVDPGHEYLGRGD